MLNSEILFTDVCDSLHRFQYTYYKQDNVRAKIDSFEIQVERAGPYSKMVNSPQWNREFDSGLLQKHSPWEIR